MLVGFRFIGFVVSAFCTAGVAYLGANIPTSPTALGPFHREILIVCAILFVALTVIAVCDFILSRREEDRRRKSDEEMAGLRVDIRTLIETAVPPGKSAPPGVTAEYSLSWPYRQDLAHQVEDAIFNARKASSALRSADDDNYLPILAQISSEFNHNYYAIHESLRNRLGFAPLGTFPWLTNADEFEQVAQRLERLSASVPRDAAAVVYPKASDDER